MCRPGNPRTSFGKGQSSGEIGTAKRCVPPSVRCHPAVLPSLRCLTESLHAACLISVLVYYVADAALGIGLQHRPGCLALLLLRTDNNLSR